MLCGDLDGKEIQKKKRGDICIHIADSLCSTVETTQHYKATMKSESVSHLAVSDSL